LPQLFAEVLGYLAKRELVFKSKEFDFVTQVKILYFVALCLLTFFRTVERGASIHQRWRQGGQSNSRLKIKQFDDPLSLDVSF
jgi:hypothetical protein